MDDEELVGVGEMELARLASNFKLNFPESVRVYVIFNDYVSSLRSEGVFVVVEEGAREFFFEYDVCALNFRPVKGFSSKITS